MATFKTILILLIVSIPIGCAGVEQPRQDAAQEAGVQMQCLAYPDMVAALARAGESPTGAGVQPDGNMMQHFAAESGAWTMLVVMAKEGYGCILSHGQGWQAAERGQKS